eukprot:UN19569
MNLPTPSMLIRPRCAFAFAPNATLRLRLFSIFSNAIRIKVWQS